ncbi:hypothetical protein BCY86_07195 [Pajaroellobacter abortibovis]|uniref:Uncharacterized protein n=1 Tax=Pajaroellobacter abortibovis TaxID=1882918 RepID=A0A1L6MY57_9BACT|nr:hypothetical protein BCY86_07195 [Pajaroellobacter abortibovis]
MIIKGSITSCIAFRLSFSSSLWEERGGRVDQKANKWLFSSLGCGLLPGCGVETNEWESQRA